MATYGIETHRPARMLQAWVGEHGRRCYCGVAYQSLREGTWNVFDSNAGGPAVASGVDERAARPALQRIARRYRPGSAAAALAA